jgi:hypothetical protein
MYSLDRDHFASIAIVLWLMVARMIGGHYQCQIHRDFQENLT